MPLGRRPLGANRVNRGVVTTVDGMEAGFQLERFEVVEGRLEVQGRWFGVRGMRFVRPSLTVRTDDGERHLLALLDHKPWAAEEGVTWTAVFPWDGGPVAPRQAELAVAPSVVVPLEAAERRRPTLHERLAAERRKVARLEDEVAWLRREHAELSARHRRAVDERNRMRSDRDALAEQVEATRIEHAETRSALQAERDDARREASRLAAERDDALRERDAARADRVPAVAQSRAAERHREAALAELDRAVAAREEALRDRDAALARAASAEAERDHAVGDRDAARREHEQALRERDTAVRARTAALAERDTARARLEALGDPDGIREPIMPQPIGRTVRPLAAGVAERRAVRAVPSPTDPSPQGSVRARKPVPASPDEPAPARRHLATAESLPRPTESLQTLRARSPIEPLGSAGASPWRARALVLAAVLLLALLVLILSRTALV